MPGSTRTNPPPATSGPAAEPLFVRELAALTGLDPKVIEAWVRVEGAYAPHGTGGNNFLNIRERTSRSGVPISGTTSAGFAQFANASDAAHEAAAWINTMPNYVGIRRAARLGPRSQLAAIAASPWDAGHYNGGRALYSAYDSLAAKGKSAWDTFTSGVGSVAGVAGDAVNPLGLVRDIPGVGSIPGVNTVGAIVSAPATLAEDATKVLGFIFNPQDWLRIGYILGGGIFVIGGLFILARSVGAPSVIQGAAMAANPEGEAYKVGQAQGRRAAARREGRKAGMASISSQESLRPRPVYQGKARKGASRSDIPF